jgi:hypothetical protein
MPSIYKTYTRSSPLEKYKVKTWRNKRCIVCGKFITTKTCKQFLCNKCYKKRHNRRVIRDNIFYYAIQSIREGLDNISIPDYLRNSLRNYM